METYKELGSRYLRTNRKRSFITMIGCFVVATILFAFLNSMVCWIEFCRIDARKNDDWEILVLTDDRATIEKIVNEDFVSSAFLGKAYGYMDETDAVGVYANALHINVKQKLLINHYSKYISKTYNVDIELNDLISWTYCQDNEGTGYLMILTCLFISFVLAIIGVGVLRNNISISAIERVKDYGNLRCIGATKKQIRAIVYRESFFVETIGIILGIIAGFFVSIPICLEDKRQYPVGFHIIPIFFLLIAFYGDMYFAVDDGLKKVLAVSPVEAVRGNYRVKAKGVRRRQSGIWGLLFGVEGDYAYKNIRRKGSRFRRTVFAMAFGMGMVVVIGGIFAVLYDFYKDINESYGYYQQFIYTDTDRAYSHEEQKVDLYSPQALKKINTAKGITDPKYMYMDTLYMTEDRWLGGHIREDYNESLHSFYYGNDVDEEKEAQQKVERKAYRDSGAGLVDYDSYEKADPENGADLKNNDRFLLLETEIQIIGYDAEDYARFDDVLIDGTTNLSANGVLLVNQAELVSDNSFQDNTLLYEMKEYTFTDLKVGDEITVVDTAELYTLVQEERKNADAYDESMHEAASEWDREHGDETDEEGNPLTNPYENYADIKNNMRKEAWIVNSAREKLVEEGKYKTYVIEGIVKGDPNCGTSMPALIVPLENFFEITGRTESDYVGMKFHVSNIFSKDLQKQDFLNAINEKNHIYYGEDEEGPTYNSYTSPYIEALTYEISAFEWVAGIIAAFVILIGISLLNTMNVTISGLQMRRNEFAQLRALGMTKRSLLKAILLEGGIVWIISSILGIVVGLAIEYAIYRTLMVHVINASMNIFWPGIIITAVLSFIVLCGSNYGFFKQMKLDVAEELTRSGE